jgi:DNA-binding NarL/FixJ family response regulator
MLWPTYRPVVARPVAGSAVRPATVKAQVCIVGGRAALQGLLSQFLATHGIVTRAVHQDEERFAESLELSPQPLATVDVILLILSGGPAGVYFRLQQALQKVAPHCPLAVLADEVSRAHVHGAIRLGAKAFVTLDAEPAEIVRAVQSAAAGNLYLTQVAMDVLTSDASAGAGAGMPQLAGQAVDGLSPREVEIIRLLCEGMGTKEVARHLHLSSKTVENHRYHVYRKLKVESIVELLRYAIQHGIVSL